MKETKIKVIDYMERLKNTTNGNPRWRVVFTDGTYANTAPDAGFVYSFRNPSFRDVPLSIEFDGRGRISDIRKVEEEK